MAEAVLKGTLKYLSSVAAAELAVFLGFDQERENLDRKFNEIKAAVEDAEKKQFSNTAIRNWLQSHKDVGYELDDIRDECAYEELRLEYEEVKCCLSEMVLSSSLSSLHPRYAIPRYKIAKKMKRIGERLDSIVKETQQLHLTEAASEEKTGIPEWRKTISSTAEPHVYGRKKDTERIVDFLIGNADASHSENLSVYPILGQGGLGKTTLAQLIFKHERVVNHFHKQRIWVCVSEDFSLQRMMKAIIEAAVREPCGDLDPEPLHRKLQDLLRSKKYLLVLDDVWDVDPNNWQKLKSVLDYGAKGSSILVTSRLAKVAEIMGTTDPHKLSLLSYNDCWELFKNAAFGPKEAEQPVLVAIGKEIIKKCGGVPLAAKAVGGLLRFKRKENQWLNVLESNLLELSDGTNSIMPVLRLSYLNLSNELRQCFAYCAIFPKDEKIEKQHLIELWMANGFVQSDGRLDAEDVGDDVWNELYWRSIFQDIETDEFGRVLSFKMHDLFHDLAQFVAGDICCITNKNGAMNLSERFHHFSDHRKTHESSEEVKYFRQQRMYNILQPYCGQISAHVLECISLRVLECRFIKELPPSIDQLKYLRYLNLSNGYFETLPESLCKLWNLQILKLDTCLNLRELPGSLIQMKALQKLSFNTCLELTRLPAHIGKLTSLRSLTTYFVGEERGFLLAELGPLNLKGDLDIKHLERVKSVEDAKEANMSSKQLNELTLSWDSDEDTELEENVEQILDVLQPDTQQLQTLEVNGYKGAHFPQWISSHSLEYLALWNCKNCLHLPALGKLPFLKKLEIRDMINVKYVYEECYDGGVVFIALESLRIRNLPNLISLSREDGENMFPGLSTLHIDSCNKFNVSRGFQWHTRLKQLSIMQCREVGGLDEALQHMTALKRLYLWDLPNLESLPDCFGNLSLLQELFIRNCLKLRCLPTSLRHSNLRSLIIWRLSHELLKRCQEETGEDWPIIAHISHIYILK